MPSIDQAFKHRFFSLLQKSSYFTSRELFALWAIITTIINNRSFSLSEVSKRFGRQVGRNFLGNVLKKYAVVQKKLIQLLVQAICDDLPPGTKVYLLFDDMIVKKRGKTMLGVLSWYDHTLGRSVRAWCLVNLAIVVDNQVVCILPYLLTRPPLSGKKRRKKAVEKDIKITTAQEMFQEVIQWFIAGGVRREAIVTLADSWFSSIGMIGPLRQSSVHYRIDGKKSYGVQVPDHEAIEAAKAQTKGRPRTHFVTYVRLDDYLGSPNHWNYFTCPETAKRVYYKVATVTLRTTGRVRVYAFRRARAKEAKFILTDPVRKRPPTAKNVYLDYRKRWRIEEAHKDLKQHLGIGRCQCREAWTISGFIGLIYFAYSVLKGETYNHKHPSTGSWTCPTWAETFYRYQLDHPGVVIAEWTTMKGL